MSRPGLEYVRDREATLERLGELEANVRAAQYELAASVALLRIVGMTWEDIGEGLGYGEGGRKQGARQWFSRNGATFGVAGADGPTMVGIDDRERARLGRVLALGSAKPRYQVRVIVSGRHGIDRVVYRTVSTHISQAVAEDRARALEAAPPAEVWRVEASGAETRLAVTRRARRRPVAASPGDELGDDEAAF